MQEFSWLGLQIFRKVAISLCTFFCVTNIVSGQDENVSAYIESKKSGMPPSPNAAALGKFGDVPVSFSTGIPTVSIPFYSYSGKSKGFGLNVSLNYHTSGHKVDDMASNVGLGWALNAGGVVTRSVRGRPDDLLYGFMNSPNLPYYYTSNFDYAFTVPSASLSTNSGICFDNSSDYYTIKNIAEGQLDGEFDIFHYSVGNISGKFFIKKNGEVVHTSQSNVKIEFVMYNSSYINEFIITDVYGNKYYFNEKEWLYNTNSLGETPPTQPMFVSSWYLQRIVSSSQQEQITFTYDNTAAMLGYESGFTNNAKTGWYQWGNSTGTEYIQSYNMTSILNPKQISYISLPSGVNLYFSYNLYRQDFYNDRALTNLVISANGLQKEFEFAYDYFTSGYSVPVPYSYNDYYKRLKLLSITEKAGSIIKPPYVFEYNSTQLPTRNSMQKDSWGYYNGTNTSTVINYISVPGNPYYPLMFNVQSVSEEYTKACMLEKITYPTGGHTSFVYESNKAVNNSTEVSVGGLRIKNIYDYDNVSGKTKNTAFTYLQSNGLTSGLIQYYPNTSYHWTTFMAGDGSMNLYKIHYLNQFTYPTQSLSYHNGSPVIYSRVKVEDFLGTQSNGYSIYDFTGFNGSFIPDENFPVIPRQESEWSQGLLLKQSIYSSQNVLLKSIENEYQNYSFSTFSDPSMRCLVAGLMYWDHLDTYNEKLYGARSYNLIFGRSELKRTIVKEFDQGLVITNATDFYYDQPGYFIPTREVYSNSKGEQITKTTTYPFNNNYSAINSDMISRNMLRYPVFSQVSNDSKGTIVKANQAIFDYVNGSVIDIREVKEKSTDAGNYNTLITYSQYDNIGNVLEAKPATGVVESYIYGYGKQFLTAKVENAVFGAMAYSSFESDDKGNWDYVGSVNSSEGITGNKSYYLSTGNIYKSGLNPSTNYIVTYWMKNGGGSVNIGGTAIANRNGWTLYRTTISSQTTLTISGTAIIDELRLYPVGAMMTSYTHHPFVGITSICDQNNRITYYEYDGFGRLKYVRDDERNIIKSYDYQYNQAQY